MKIQLIRHATLLVYINNKKILVDPMLSTKGSMNAVPGVPDTSNNPLVELPVEMNEIIDEIDAILITHTHRDHFDDTAAEILPKVIPVICQTEDCEKIKAKGFSEVYSCDKSLDLLGISFVRTGGKHGHGEMAKKMAPVSGYVLNAKAEPGLYITGDTVWCSEVEDALEIYKPDITVCFCGGAQFNTDLPITMTADDILKLCEKAPYTKVIGAHMEAWNHCRLSRGELRRFLDMKSLNKQVYIPEDGKILNSKELL